MRTSWEISGSVRRFALGALVAIAAESFWLNQGEFEGYWPIFFPVLGLHVLTVVAAVLFGIQRVDREDSPP